MVSGAISGQPMARVTWVTPAPITRPVRPTPRNCQPVNEVAKPLSAMPPSSTTAPRSTQEWTSGSRWCGRLRVAVSA
jgi:hypothetical protein